MILGTLIGMFLQYSKSKNLKKLFIGLATFVAIVSLAIMGNLTRQVMPIYLLHIILIIFSWGGLIFYLIKDKFYWWIIFSPIVTIGLFLILEMFIGSGNEAIPTI